MSLVLFHHLSSSSKRYTKSAGFRFLRGNSCDVFWAVDTILDDFERRVLDAGMVEMVRNDMINFQKLERFTVGLSEKHKIPTFRIDTERCYWGKWHMFNPANPLNQEVIAFMRQIHAEINLNHRAFLCQKSIALAKRLTFLRDLFLFIFNFFVSIF